MQEYSVAVAGAGASGILAAISAAKNGKDVILLERMPSPGRKILASGNGRCNLLNEDINPSKYNPAAKSLVSSILNIFGRKEAELFFTSAGLRIYSEEDGRIFPATNQSSSVLRILEIELKRLAVPVELNFNIAGISDIKDGFTVSSKSGKKISCRKLILAGGGRSYPALGSDGSAYGLASSFGHKIIKPVPAAVPVVVKDAMCHLLQGQRISAKVTAVIDGRKSCEALGDLLFTKYGLSGTSILDISQDISIAMNRHDKRDVAVSADLVPFADESDLRNEMAKRLAKGWPSDDLTAGILPNKFASALRDITKTRDAGKIAVSLKTRLFRVLETRGWNEAEFTSGGIDTSEVWESTLESRLKKGLYFAGEVLDVTGARGGYNLAWAWASGYVAGLLR